MKEMMPIVNLKMMGPDNEGIIKVLSKAMIKNRINPISLEKTSLNENNIINLLLDLSPYEIHGKQILKDLELKATDLGLSFDQEFYSNLEEFEYSRTKKYALTHFGGLEATALFSDILRSEIVDIENVSTRLEKEIEISEIIFSTTGSSELKHLKKKLLNESRKRNIDISLQSLDSFRKDKRLIVFDMDSTLIDMEIIDELAKKAGVVEEVSEITSRAMNGELDFSESLKHRVGLLKGLNVDDLKQVRESIKLSEGVEDLTMTLKWMGYKMGIVTGGFDFFADYMKEKFGFDFVYSNRLEVKDGVLTGHVEGPIIDAKGKAEIVNRSACDLGIPLERTVVVGDGANDAQMISLAGLGIAYNAKKGLEEIAHASLSKNNFSRLSHLLGITEDEIREAASCRLI